MILGPKSGVSGDDLRALVANKVHEGQTLEYKAALPTKSDTDRKEFLKDVSALANAQGGDIVFGISEDRITGAPKDLSGIIGTQEAGGPPAVIERLQSMLVTGLVPRLHGVHFEPIDLGASESALLVRVPQSWSRPHGYSLGPETRFAIRHGNTSQPMSMDELRDAFAGSATAASRLRAIADERLSDIRGRHAGIGEGKPHLVVHLLPFDTLRVSQRRDLRSIKRSRFLKALPCRYSGNVRFSIDGVLCEDSHNDGTVASYVMVGWNGLVEAVSHIDQDKPDLIYGDFVEQGIVTACVFYSRLLAELGEQPPILVTGAMLRVSGCRVRKVNLASGAGIPIDRDTISLPDVVLQDLNVSDARDLRPLLDAVWNASGFEASPFFDEAGQYTAPLPGVP